MERKEEAWFYRGQLNCSYEGSIFLSYSENNYGDMDRALTLNLDVNTLFIYVYYLCDTFKDIHCNPTIGKSKILK